MASFDSVLDKALTACDLALSDILSARAAGGSVDTKILKEVSAAVKDLNALSPDSGAINLGYTVRVSAADEPLAQ